MRFRGAEIRTLLPKPQAASLIVAASDSLYKERADYVCNGTADNIEIQAAIDTLPTTGGTILLLDGTFTTAAELSIPNANIRLSGCGKSTILSITSDINIINTNSKSDIIINNIYFSSNGQGTGTYANSSANCIIHDCWFNNLYNGISLLSSNTCTIYNNRCLSNVYNGIRVDTSNYCIIDKNICTDNDSDDTGNYSGILLAASDRCIVSSNICYDTRGPGSKTQTYGINISNATCDKVKVIGNILYENKTGGINNAGTNTEIDHNQTV